jgi:regulator of extracellular matrix RemA (YlzA/DUF370 family)
LSKFVNIGFGNVVNTDRIVAVVSPDSAPIKRLVQNAREQGHIIDATQGRKTKGVLFTESDSIILSALLPETLAARFGQTGRETAGREEDEDEE